MRIIFKMCRKSNLKRALISNSNQKYFRRSKTIQIILINHKKNKYLIEINNNIMINNNKIVIHNNNNIMINNNKIIININKENMININNKNINLGMYLRNYITTERK